MTVSDKIKTISKKTEENEPHIRLDGQTAVILALSTGNYVIISFSHLKIFYFEELLEKASYILIITITITVKNITNTIDLQKIKIKFTLGKNGIKD